MELSYGNGGVARALKFKFLDILKLRVVWKFGLYLKDCIILLVLYKQSFCKMFNEHHHKDPRTSSCQRFVDPVVGRRLPDSTFFTYENINYVNYGIWSENGHNSTLFHYKLCWHSTDTFSVQPESPVESSQHLFISSCWFGLTVSDTSCEFHLGPLCLSHATDTCSFATFYRVLYKILITNLGWVCITFYSIQPLKILEIFTSLTEMATNKTYLMWLSHVRWH